MSTEFASASLTAGQLNAIVKKLGGYDQALRFLKGELTVSQPSPSWHEEDGVIYFSVMSDGTTGEDWIKRLESKGFRVDGYAKQVLHSPDFKPTSGVTTEVVVLKSMFFEDNGVLFEDYNWTTKKICTEASYRNFTKPNAELACLIREKFTDEEIEAMGLVWIVAMHKPINDLEGDPSLLCVHHNLGGCRFDAYVDRPGSRWDRDGGFAFAVS